MSNKENLKQYLIEKNKPYLLNKDNNGKTIMLSGAWGAGKTYFWQKEIEPKLKEKLEEIEKTCLYVSLYGKDNLDALKKEILINASSIDELFSKEVSSFGFDVLSSIQNSDLKIGQLLKAFSEATNSEKSIRGMEALQNGGVICFDDFERKSTKINLNDLFGFISQLAIELSCKIVIILNSDVFVGKEAEVFSHVKEKTINKFLYFQPSIEELFETISSDEKYGSLDEYKVHILNAIKETEELNARVYIQVLDNCLEWLQVKKNLDEYIVRVLVLGTFNFVLNHMVLDYQEIIVSPNNHPSLRYRIIELYTVKLDIFNSYIDDTKVGLRIKANEISSENIIRNLKIVVESTGGLSEPLKEKNQEEHLIWINDNEPKLKALWKYGYQLYYVADVDERTYNEIAEFIKSGMII